MTAYLDCGLISVEAFRLRGPEFQGVLEMTTEVVATTTENVIDVPAMVKERDGLESKYQSKLAELGVAGAANDLQKMMALGAELTSIRNASDKLTRKISRATGKSSPDSKAKLDARQAAFNALQDFMGTPGGEALRAFKVVNPALKQVRVVWADDGTISFDSVGGIRVVTKTGTKRARSYFTGNGLAADKNVAGAVLPGAKPETVYSLYARKYKFAETWKDVSPSDRKTRLDAIVTGEKLTKVTS